MVRRRPISWCGPGLRRGSRARCSTSWSSGARKSRSPARANSGCGAAACFSSSASLTRKSEPMTRAGLIERLADREPGRRGFGGTDDPLEAAAFRLVLRGDHDLNPGMTPPGTALRPAAVLVPLIDHPGGMAVLLTQRTAHLSAHAGQISFPGGRIEADDPDAITAALRETEEEVGLSRDQVRVIGRLDTYVTGTGFEITPIVGIVEPPIVLAIHPF